MIDLSKIPGVTVLKEGDLPPAIRDMIGSTGGIAAFTADDLPPNFDAVIGAGPGVTVILADDRPAPARRAPQVADLIAEVARIGRDLEHLRQASDDLAATGAASVLRTALLALASTPAGRNRDVREKARCLRSHLTAAAFDPIGEGMIEAALSLDAEAWGIGKTGH